jgi:hypothetical protein
MPAVSMGCGIWAGGGSQSNVTYALIASTSLVNHLAISYSICHNTKLNCWFIH